MQHQQKDVENSSELASRVHAAIKRNGYIRLSGIKCEAHGSTVVLKGMLTTFYLKQVAKSIASKVPGVEKVVDEIIVTGDRDDRVF